MSETLNFGGTYEASFTFTTDDPDTFNLLAGFTYSKTASIVCERRIDLDPSHRIVRGWRELLRQVRDILAYEFRRAAWPERTPSEETLRITVPAANFHVKWA